MKVAQTDVRRSVFRTGRYRDAVLANVNAYNADLFFGQNCMQPYEPEHNTDMLIFAANMAGQVHTDCKPL